ncbi:MAG TPA: helix-turn-helix domain-containing protein [Solirubrobacterales bacterium]|jgi:AcrR family transcriptional regulator|nr:helix-turn-helix domain-containing protein [Solirubrobacterales bacterium]
MAADAKAPAKRADATRNRDKILAAAREAFADPEAEVSMAEVARRAGVGMATLYRNFPGRRELLEALYSEVIDGILVAAEERSGETAGERFTAWLRAFLDFSTSKRQLVAELLAEDDDRSVFNQNRARVLAAGAPLLAAAQKSGEVRKDLSLAQILELVIAVGKIRGDATFVEPILDATLEGLRPPN